MDEIIFKQMNTILSNMSMYLDRNGLFMHLKIGEQDMMLTPEVCGRIAEAIDEAWKPITCMWPVGATRTGFFCTTGSGDNQKVVAVSMSFGALNIERTLFIMSVEVFVDDTVLTFNGKYTEEAAHSLIEVLRERSQLYVRPIVTNK